MVLAAPKKPMTDMPRTYTEDELGFPPSYLTAIQTPHGLAYPPPRIRLLIDDIENVQKRIANVQMQAHPERLSRVYGKKSEREERFKELQAEYALLTRELTLTMKKLSEFPAGPEQFIPPMEEVKGMKRVNREDWAGEFRAAIEERSEVVFSAIENDRNEAIQKSEDGPELGTFLQL